MSPVLSHPEISTVLCLLTRKGFTPAQVGVSVPGATPDVVAEVARKRVKEIEFELDGFDRAAAHRISTDWHSVTSLCDERHSLRGHAGDPQTEDERRAYHADRMLKVRCLYFPAADVASLVDCPDRDRGQFHGHRVGVHARAGLLSACGKLAGSLAGVIAEASEHALLDGPEAKQYVDVKASLFELEALAEFAGPGSAWVARRVEDERRKLAALRSKGRERSDALSAGLTARLAKGDTSALTELLALVNSRSSRYAPETERSIRLAVYEAIKAAA